MRIPEAQLWDFGHPFRRALRNRGSLLRGGEKTALKEPEAWNHYYAFDSQSNRALGRGCSRTGDVGEVASVSCLNGGPMERAALGDLPTKRAFQVIAERASLQVPMSAGAIDAV